LNRGDESRPDGRAAGPETQRLRVATRALRFHLDALPIDYHLEGTPDRFVAGMAFMFARQRYDLADSMIGASFGGTVLGSIARSLFVDGLRWMWMGQDPERCRNLLGDLLAERNRICVLIEDTGASCPVLARWLMPLPDVADLTGESMTWLDAKPMPDENQLIEHFLREADRSNASMPPDTTRIPFEERTRELFNMAGLRGAVMVLAHAGHGNYLGLQSSLAEDGVPGHDLRPAHEALFMQVAAAGATATLLGSAAATPGSWPVDVDRGPFLQRAVELSTDVAEAAVALHKLGTRSRVASRATRVPHASKTVILRPGTILRADDLLPDVNSADHVIAAAERYYEVARSITIDPWAHGQPSLHDALTYGGGLSGLESVMATYDKQGSAVISIFAARMLLEEAARLRWRFSVHEENAFKARATQFFDEYRARRRKTINLLMSSGVPREDAERIFSLPSYVHVVTPEDRVTPNRRRLPNISSMLRQLGASYPEPGWLEVAYSLLSQITHSTPIGHLHAVKVRDGTWHGNELSTEMLGLALDVACLGSAEMIGHSALVLTNMSAKAVDYRNKLLAEARAVHNAARLVHGLD
jgi:hypothetical protein